MFNENRINQLEVLLGELRREIDSLKSRRYLETARLQGDLKKQQALLNELIDHVYGGALLKELIDHVLDHVYCGAQDVGE